MKDNVAQNAGVIHENVDAAESSERGFDNLVSVLRLDDRQGRGDGLSACLLDLVDDLLRRSGVGAGTLQARADVADHDVCALLRQPERNRAPDATRPPSDDGDLA